MPIYEYRCKKCSTEFEMILPIGQRDMARCPICRREVELKVSVPSVISDDLGTTYMDPTFGNVHSKSELRKMEKQAGLRASEPGDDKAIKRFWREKEKKEDIVRERMIGQTVQEMVV